MKKKDFSGAPLQSAEGRKSAKVEIGNASELMNNKQKILSFSLSHSNCSRYESTWLSVRDTRGRHSHELRYRKYKNSAFIVQGSELGISRRYGDMLERDTTTHTERETY